MTIPTQGQKTIPLKDWRRFLRVADWYERTHEQGNGTRVPSYGQALLVKTPVDGIDARVDETISSATCTRCVAAETSTPGEKTIIETADTLVVYNAEEHDIRGEIFVKTVLSPNGTRYVDPGRNDLQLYEATADATYDTSVNEWKVEAKPRDWDADTSLYVTDAAASAVTLWFPAFVRGDLGGETAADALTRLMPMSTGGMMWATERDGRWDVVSIQQGEKLRVELIDVLTPNLTGAATSTTANVLFSSSYTRDVAPPTITIYDPTGSKRGRKQTSSPAKRGSTAVVEYFHDSKRWEIMEIEETASRCTCFLTGAISGTGVTS